MTIEVFCLMVIAAATCLCAVFLYGMLEGLAKIAKDVRDIQLRVETRVSNDETRRAKRELLG